MFTASRRKADGSSAPPTALTSAVREAGRFDSASVSVAAGLLAAIPVAVVLGGAIAAGDPVAGATMGAGAMLVGIAWRTGGGQPPLALMATDAVVMAGSTFVGAVSGSLALLHLAVLCLWSAMAGLLVAVGRRGAVIGTQAIIAVVVFGRFSQSVPGALGLAGLVLAGGFAQVLFLWLVRWPAPLRAQRAATAAAYRALSELAAAPTDASTLPAAGALDTAEATLASPSLLGDPAVMTLRSLVDEGHRMRIHLSAIHALLRQQEAIGADSEGASRQAAERMLELSAGGLELAGLSIQGDASAAAALTGPITALNSELGTLGSSSETAAPEKGLADSALPMARRLAALAGQLRAVAALAPAAGESGSLRSRRPHRRTSRPLERMRSDVALIRANASLGSPAGRHALRLAIIVPAAELISRQLPLQRGYWMVVAAATVLRPEFAATFTRGTERALGTSLGVGLAGAITVGLHPAGGVTVVIVGLLAWAGYAVFPASFAVGFGFITALVVFLLNAVSPDTLSIASARLLDTAVGGTIGLLAYALWPTWSRASARQSLVDLVSAQREYLGRALAGFIDGRPAQEQQMRPLARRARLARTSAEAAVERSLSEPRTRRIDAAQSHGALAATRRLVQAAHVLRLDAQETPDRSPLPALAPLAGDIDRLMKLVETELRDEHHAHPGAPELPDLRADYADFERSSAHDSDSLALLAELDEIVDAANGLASLVGLEPMPPGAEPE